MPKSYRSVETQEPVFLLVFMCLIILFSYLKEHIILFVMF